MFEALHLGMREAFRVANQQLFYLPFDVAVQGSRNAASSLGTECSEADGRAMAERTAHTSFDEITPRPRMRQALDTLRARGIHLGGVSNADECQLDAMVDALGVRDVFHHLLSSEAARSCKPNAAIFHQALEQAGCAPEETFFVCDTPYADIIGAEGMRMALIEEATLIAIDRARQSQAS